MNFIQPRFWRKIFHWRYWLTQIYTVRMIGARHFNFHWEPNFILFNSYSSSIKLLNSIDFSISENFPLLRQLFCSLRSWWWNCWSDSNNFFWHKLVCVLRSNPQVYLDFEMKCYLWKTNWPCQAEAYRVNWNRKSKIGRTDCISAEKLTENQSRVKLTIAIC